MRILYGVVGEGMGHATRSRVVLAHLASMGHEVRVVVSGRAHAFLRRAFVGESAISIREIHGFHLAFDGNDLDVPATVWENLAQAPLGLLKNLEQYTLVATDGFVPQMVISDFESMAYVYGRTHGLPVLSIDNMQVMNRCLHKDDVTDDQSFDWKLTKTAVKMKLPGAYHYLITTFFCPPVRKPRTTLVPPILRPEILAAKREPGSHVLVYQNVSSSAEILPVLKTLPYEFRLYGSGKTGQDGNVTLCAFSETGFVDDLRTARGVIASAGFSLMGEVVHLRVPMFALPFGGQFEQELNARYLARLGYGAWAPRIDHDAIERFLADTDAHAHALEGYVPHDNSMTLGCVDEIVRDVDFREKPPERLEHEALGKYWGKLALDEDPI